MLHGAGRTRSVPTPVIARPWTAGLPFPAQRSAGEAVGSGPPTPSSTIDAENDPAVATALPRLDQAVRDLTEVRDSLPTTLPDSPPIPARDLLSADIAELAGHVLAQGTRVHVRGVLAAARAGEPDGVRAHMRRLRADLLRLDDLADAAAHGPVPPDADPTPLHEQIVTIEETWRGSTRSSAR